MLHAKILRADNSTLLEDVEIDVQPSKRGSKDGHIWRGRFAVPAMTLRPMLGETIQLLLNVDDVVSCVVTEVVQDVIHFRANGTMPKTESSDPAEQLGESKF